MRGYFRYRGSPLVVILMTRSFKTSPLEEIPKTSASSGPTNIRAGPLRTMVHRWFLLVKAKNHGRSSSYPSGGAMTAHARHMPNDTRAFATHDSPLRGALGSPWITVITVSLGTTSVGTQWNHLDSFPSQNTSMTGWIAIWQTCQYHGMRGTVFCPDKENRKTLVIAYPRMDIQINFFRIVFNLDLQK